MSPMTFRKHYLIFSLAIFSMMMPALPAYPLTAPQQKSATKQKKSTGGKTATAKGTTQKNSKTTQGTATKKSSQTQPAKQGSSRRKGSGNAKGSVKQETSADVKKKQEATQKEIRQTEQQIKENDRSIKKGLSDLGKIEGEISNSKQKIAVTSGKIAKLNGEISTLQAGIAGNEKELQRLRDEYLKAVKKMRVARKQKSDLAFIFASDNFNQALRRMRYLRQFSEWKDRQTAAIDGKTAELKKQQASLATAKSEQDKALRQQKSDQALLQQQYVKQDAIVADLRKNGEALKTHLAKKQTEANQLKSRISALIAEEQRKAEEERRARLEAERKRAEAERAAREKREREAAERAEKERLLAEQRSASKAAAKAAEEDQARLAKAEREKATRNNKGTDKPTYTKETEKKDNGNYADARRRTPRSNTYVESAKPVSKPSAKSEVKPAKVQSSPAAEPAAVSSSAGAAFASMKGSLPRPVSGSFRITSRFGRQSFPDLPSVVYDNPGIDAETSTGAAALAVYHGKVSGVYMIPGYNTVVIVNHGNYYTVYGNIASPSVKVGDAVNAGQRLGGLAPDEDNQGHSSIHFEVWRNREKLNPLEWIR
ncbi:MAG: peptidoglycan DD-metalloendopeptidase family protein [Muribaculaceae bacterium]|nr:peptidoglycan DD-metalloendopeptidase family protein [Muribaculaceae bacterium]